MRWGGQGLVPQFKRSDDVLAVVVARAPLPAEGLDLVECDAQGGQGGPVRCLVLCSHALQQRHV